MESDLGVIVGRDTESIAREVYVPVSIDADREVEGVDMYRATYFIVTTGTPADVWEIALPPLADIRGLGALGMLGVVFGTIRSTSDPGREATGFDIFHDPQEVEAIFSLEETGTLSIQLEDLWLPQIWCAGAADWGGTTSSDDEVKRGDVFRIGLALFQQAYRYSIGDIPIRDLLALDTSGLVFRSPREAAAFGYWAESQIDLSREAFEAAPDELKLRWE